LLRLMCFDRKIRCREQKSLCTSTSLHYVTIRTYSSTSTVREPVSAAVASKPPTHAYKYVRYNSDVLLLAHVTCPCLLWEIVTCFFAARACVNVTYCTVRYCTGYGTLSSAAILLGRAHTAARAAHLGVGFLCFRLLFCHLTYLDVQSQESSGHKVSNETTLSIDSFPCHPSFPS